MLPAWGHPADKLQAQEQSPLLRGGGGLGPSVGSAQPHCPLHYLALSFLLEPDLMNSVYLKNPSFKSIAEYLKAKCSVKTALGGVDFPRAFTLPCFLEFCEASQMSGELRSKVLGPPEAWNSWGN